MTSAKKPTGRKQARKGDGSIYWDEKNQCYSGSISLGTKPDGTRNRPSVHGATQKEVRAKLKALKDDFDDGIELGDKYTVENAVPTSSRAACEDSALPLSRSSACTPRSGSSRIWGRRS